MRGRFSTGPPSRPVDTQPGASGASVNHNSMDENAAGKQTAFEDPPEVDPSTVEPQGDNKKRGMPFRGRGRFGRAFGSDDEDNKDGRHRGCRGRDRFEHAPEDEEGLRRHRDGRPCRGGRRHGPPGSPFMFEHPWFGRPPFGPPPHEHGRRSGPPPHDHGPRSGPPHEHGPSFGPPPHHRHGGPEHERRQNRGPHDRHDRGHGPMPPFGRHGPFGPQGFNLGSFLSNLGGKLGVDLVGAAEGFGIPAAQFTGSRRNNETDFEPRADIFENKKYYTVHLSLPGAKKEDVAVDYDGENSTLRITGVVHRPEVDEKMLIELAVDGRKREIGAFEKAIRLGTKHDPASIDVAHITAKMIDGVLVIKIPKAAVVHQRRSVTVDHEEQETGVTSQDVADYDNEYSEKPDLFNSQDENETMHDVHAREGNLVDMEVDTYPASAKEKEVVAEKVATGKESVASKEQLPIYSAESTSHKAAFEDICESDQEQESDWEKFSGDDGEGEYVKINVN